MKFYYDIGFKGPTRPDHVPTMAGDSNERQGYSTIGTLFALGYMRGLVETISKMGARHDLISKLLILKFDNHEK